MNYHFLCDDKENLENKIKSLLDSKQFYWSEIYIFSAFFDEDGVKKVKQILSQDCLTENAKIVIAIGSKNLFNSSENIKEILDFIESEKSQKLKNKSVQFICPKNNFHIKAYCFLGRNRKKIKADIQIGVSIIGSSNLTKAGLECQGELCISIVNFNLTKTLIARLSEIYIDYNKYDLWEKIINEYKNNQYNSWGKRIKEFEEKINTYNGESSENQNEDPQPLVKAESKYVQDQAPITSTPPDGKFLKLGVLTYSVLLAKKKSLVDDYSEDAINAFYSSRETIDQVKNDFIVGSLCLSVDIENIFRIVKIVKIMPYPYKTEQNEIQGCFVIFRENVTYEPSDIGEILAKEKYKIISDAKNMDKLPYKTLKNFEEEVKEYQKMLNDPNYKKGLEKGEKKMQKMQSEIDTILELESDPSLMKEQIKKILQSI